MNNRRDCPSPMASGSLTPKSPGTPLTPRTTGTPLYLHRDLSRAESEMLLLGSNVNGDFVVRESSTCAGSYAIDLLHNGKINHYRIERDDKGFLFFKPRKHVEVRKFPSLRSLLVDHMGSSQCLGLAHPLVRPVVSMIHRPEEIRKPPPPPPQQEGCPVPDRGEAVDMITFSVNDKVKVGVTFDRLKTLQEGHGGCKRQMKDILNDVGVIQKVDRCGDLHVKFSNDQHFVLNPRACVRWRHMVSGHCSESDSDSEAIDTGHPGEAQSAPGCNKFRVNDQIKIHATANDLKVMQRGHGGYRDIMGQAIGSVGILTDICPSGDLKIKFPQGTFTLNPEACVSLNPEVHKSSASHKATKCDGSDTNGGESGPLCVGDRVSVTASREDLRVLQEGHGGWSESMHKIVGASGKVAAILDDGDVCVTFYGVGRFLLNPSACVRVKVSAPKVGGYEKVGIPRPEVESTSNENNSNNNSDKYDCPVCLCAPVQVTFGCGHVMCGECSQAIQNCCPMCRETITSRIKLYL